jgi:hypothetical protein
VYSCGEPHVHIPSTHAHTPNRTLHKPWQFWTQISCHCKE